MAAEVEEGSSGVQGSVRAGTCLSLSEVFMKSLKGGWERPSHIFNCVEEHGEQKSGAG